MTTSITDIYVSHASGSLTLQGATHAAIELLRGHYALTNGTTAHVALESAEEAFALIDAAGLQTLTF